MYFYDIVPNVWKTVFGVFHANIFRPLIAFCDKSWPYGQPGQLPIGNLVASLIELKAQIL